MGYYSWVKSWACINCADIDDYSKTNWCPNCGSEVGHEKVLIKLHHTLFSSRIVEIKRANDDFTINRYIKALADILELEVDGEGDNGKYEYLSECMNIAMNKARQ